MERIFCKLGILYNICIRPTYFVTLFRAHCSLLISALYRLSTIRLPHNTSDSCSKNHYSCLQWVHSTEQCVHSTEQCNSTTRSSRPTMGQRIFEEDAENSSQMIYSSPGGRPEIAPHYLWIGSGWSGWSLQASAGCLLAKRVAIQRACYRRRHPGMVASPSVPPSCTCSCSKHWYLLVFTLIPITFFMSLIHIDACYQTVLCYR